MLQNNRQWLRLLFVVALLTVVLPSLLGCIGSAAQFVYMIKGAKVDAEYDGLKGKRVAVVCISKNSAFGPDSETSILARRVRQILMQKVKRIELVHQNEIISWRDSHDWDQIDYRQIGRAVKADMVLAIDMHSFRYHQGSTLFQGQAELEISVYDMTKGGAETWSKSPQEITFPANKGAIATTEMSDAQFRNKFIALLAQDVAKYFYDYDIQEDFGRNSAFIR